MKMIIYIVRISGFIYQVNFGFDKQRAQVFQINYQIAITVRMTYRRVLFFKTAVASIESALFRIGIHVAKTVSNLIWISYADFFCILSYNRTCGSLQ